MNDKKKTKSQLIDELKRLRKEYSELEKSASRRRQANNLPSEQNGDAGSSWNTDENEYYRSLVERAADGIIVATPSGSIINANQISLAMLGYSLEEVTQLGLPDLIPPEDLENNPIGLEKPGYAISALSERRLLCKGGETVRVEISVRELPDGNLQGIVRDLRGRTKSETALQDSLTRYRALLTALPDLIFRFDSKGVFLDYHAPTVEGRLYVTPEVFLGKAIDDVMPAGVAKEFHQAMDKALASQSLKRFEYQLEMPDGLHNFEARLTVSGVNEVTAVVRDITRQKAVEEHLRISEIRYRNTIAQSPYSIVIYSPDGRVLSANDVALKIWDITPAGLEHIKSKYIVFEDKQLEELGLLPFLKRAFAGEATRLPAIEYDVQQTPEPQAVSDAPARHWIKGYAYPVKDEEGNVREVVVTHEDISHQKQVEEALRTSEKRFRELAENIQEVFWLFDWQKKRLIYASPAYEQIWGRPVERLYENPGEWGDNMHPDDRIDPQHSFLQIVDSGKEYAREYRIVRPGGEVRWVYDRGFPVRDEDGAIKNIAGIAEDITARKQAENVLKNSEEKFRALAEQSPNMIFIIRKTGVVYANRKCEEILGYSLEEICSADFDILNVMTAEDRNTARWSFKTHMEGKTVEPAEFTLVAKNGQTLDVVVNTRLMDHEGENAILGIVTDISRQKQVENKLAFIASHDALTGLPNRMALDERMEQALNQAARNESKIGLLLLDLDNFKEVNDTYGHPTGDRLLQAVAKRLTKGLRKSDTVARAGGDEFMLLLVDLEEPAGLNTVSQKTLDAVRLPFRIDDHEIAVTTSIGIAQFPIDAQNVTDLKKYADIALYRAKDQGGDTFAYYTQLSRLEAH